MNPHIEIVIELMRARFRHIYCISFVVILTLSWVTTHAQDIEKVIKAKPIQFSGGIGINLGAYRAFGTENRRDPFQYLLSANLNIKLFDVINIPLGASISQQESRFMQAYNQYGFSPQYKFVTTHFGYRSMSFSPYTLNGHTFLGGGTEIELPTTRGPILKVAAMYGRFRRSVQPDDATLNNGQGAYKRIGYGAKVSMAARNKPVNLLNLSLFKGRDLVNSIDVPFINETITPMENVALGVQGQLEIIDGLIVKVDYGNSALTRDVRNEKIEGQEVPLAYRFLGKFFETRQGTEFNNALTSKLDYHFNRLTIGLQYKRIDPGYLTLGSYYFQNDIEDMTLNTGLLSKNGKINVSGSLGRQRNNLEGDKSTQNVRLIGSLNYSHQLTKLLNLSASFSNYSATLKVEQEELSDSLNLYQVTTNYNLSVNYKLPNNNSSSLWLNASYQKGNSRDEYRVFDDENSFYNISTGYRMSTKKNQVSLNVAMNYNNIIAMVGSTQRIGPSLTLSKPFIDKKLRSSYTLSFNQTLVEQGDNYGLLSNRLSLSYNLEKKGSLSFSLAHFFKNDSRANANSFSELRGGMSYRYSF